jgi:hypothetical protein
MQQIVYLTPKRAVAWKCLSLEAGGSGGEFAPVAYASLSDRFFPGMENQKAPGVLWVLSSPKYERPGASQRSFPPTLAAKLVVDRVVTGDLVRGWARDARDCDLDAPSDERRFQQWRRARSVRGAARRAAFRIARDFAMRAWNQRGRKGLARGYSQLDAWNEVRTAMADRENSRFLAHVDATECLRARGLVKGSAEVGTRLQSPRRLPGELCVADLERLAKAGSRHTVFLSYRWNAKADRVAALAKKLLALKCGIWLDGLAIPHFESHPVWRIGGRMRRKDPPQVDLERLLLNGIEASSLFVCLAASDYKDAPPGDPRGKNWAMREYLHAVGREAKTGAPAIRVVDLGGAPECLAQPRGRVLKGSTARLAGKLAGIARRS